MTEEEVKTKLNSALDRLVEKDSFLLECNVNERSISHRLAVYLGHEFEGWDVDCEYNRNMDDPKRMNLQEVDSDSTDTEGKTVYPDIIVHKRGESNNLLVVEMKKTTSHIGDFFDLHKLDAFKKQLGYRNAVFVKVKTLNSVGYEVPIWK